MPYRQNRLFQFNQSKFYQELDGKSHEENVVPDKEKTRVFWSRIWERDVKHNKSKDWILKVAGEMQGKNQHNIEITPIKVKERIPKLTNWKTPGPDGVKGYWIKMFASKQERKTFHLKSCNYKWITILDDNCSDCSTIERQEQRKRSEQL